MHGEDVLAVGGRGYDKGNWTADKLEKEGELTVLILTKKPAGGRLTDGQKALKRFRSVLRAIVEYPLPVVKC